jgi:CheY-like chemotaxis protein
MSSRFLLHEPDSLTTPRILAVDDDAPIHASLRLRLGDHHDLVTCADPRVALNKVRQERFDLCIVDLHMPVMDGLSFIEAAREIDPGLGFVVLSGHGTEDNLRRAIPLQVYDFIDKPLPDRNGLELQLPGWIQRTRQRRQELALVKDTGSIARELHTAQIERDIEFTASESARDALLQSANLLTTVNALLASAGHQLASREKPDASLAALTRTIQEARKAAEAATTVAESFFNTAYANRDNSPAVLGGCLTNAVAICSRWGHIDQHRKAFDVAGTEENAIVRSLTGIELLLLLIPLVGAAVELAATGTTVQIRTKGTVRLDTAQREMKSSGVAWMNRRFALHTHPGVVISIRTNSPALGQDQIKSWLEGDTQSPIRLPARGLLHGLRKAQGMLGFSVAPGHGRFELLLLLPT